MLIAGIDDYGLSHDANLPLRIPESSPKITGLIADSLVPAGGVIALHLQVEGTLYSFMTAAIAEK